MKNLDIVRDIIDDILKSNIVIQLISNNNDVKFAIDNTVYSRNRFGYFDPEKMLVCICCNNISKMFERPIDEDTKYCLYFEILNTIVHEYRHVKQFKRLRGIVGRKNAPKIFFNYKDYMKNPFESDAFKYAEMIAPSMEYETFGAYSTEKEAEISFMAILAKAIKEMIPEIIRKTFVFSDDMIFRDEHLTIQFFKPSAFLSIRGNFCFWDSS